MNQSGETAGTLILIGLVIQVVEVLLFFLAGAVLLIFPFLGVVLLLLAVLGLLFVVLVYLFSYDRTRQGDYAGARTPTLVFAILSLLTTLIPGVLYLIAYVKLGDAMTEGPGAMGQPPYYAPPPAVFAAPPPPLASAAPPPPAAPPPAGGGGFCSQCGSALVPGARFCRNCGRPAG
ncbi:MAG TPA: zinc ribbon domain-containing protein [Thermoplasmata archaeon]|nr:zinc ribbon domain-containing protein [Thermoplasmata archaeon]